MSEKPDLHHQQMRLDKWLWCARFFRTRSLAAAAIKTGKVQMGETKVKAGRLIKPGDELTLYLKPYCHEITVHALAKTRLSAALATSLYLESEASLEKNASRAAQLRTAAHALTAPLKRPDKRNRRKIIRFTRQSG